MPTLPSVDASKLYRVLDEEDEEESDYTGKCDECGRFSVTEPIVCKGTRNVANKGRFFQKVKRLYSVERLSQI
jgi:hypothetical protein